MADINAKVVELLKKALALLGNDDADEAAEEETETPTLPSLKEIKLLDDDDALALAKTFMVKVKKGSVAKSLLITAALCVAEKPVKDDDDLTTLADAVGLDTEDKDADELSTAIKEYFEGEATEEAAEDESEDEDEDAKPKKADDDDEDEEASDEEAEDEEASDDEDEAADEEAELTDKEKLAAYNKVAKVKLKKYDQLEELLTDSDGEVAEWGTAYSKLADPDDEDSLAAFCCGLQLKDVKFKGKEAGKCLVTGKYFGQDKKGNLVELS